MSSTTTTTTTTPPRPNIAFLLFPHVDVLDFSGPLEVLTGAVHTKAYPPTAFAYNTTLIARTSTIPCGSRSVMTVTPDTTIAEARTRLSDFDILVVPGGESPIVMEMMKGGGPEVEFIKEFNAMGEGKVILTICTGALLVAASGALKGMRATTHHMAVEAMRGIDGSVDVVSHVGGGGVGRYVDCEKNEQGVRVVTAGGVTCGMDAALFVAELTVGREMAAFLALVLEHDWKRVEN